MRIALAFLPFLLSGCGAIPYLQYHAADIAIIGTTAAAVSQVESVAINTSILVKDAKK